MKIAASLLLVVFVSLAVNATNVQNLRSQIVQAASDSPCSGTCSSSHNHHQKGDVQHVPVVQTVVVTNNGKESTPLLFHHRKEANGMIRAATVPRADSGPVIPLVLQKDGTVASQTPLVPVSSPSAPASFVEIEQKRMDQSVMAEVELSSVTHGNEPEKNQQEFEEQYEFRQVVDSTKENLNEILQKASDLSARLQDEYTKRV